MAEAGIAGYDATSWYGMLAPAATPRAAISKLGEESAKALAAADLRERLLAQAHRSGERAASRNSRPLLAAEIPKWEKVIAAAKIPPQ